MKIAVAAVLCSAADSMRHRWVHLWHSSVYIAQNVLILITADLKGCLDLHDPSHRWGFALVNQPARYRRIFVTGDVISLLMQSLGTFTSDAPLSPILTRIDGGHGEDNQVEV